jgi:hypothetical protein
MTKGNSHAVDANEFPLQIILTNLNSTKTYNAFSAGQVSLSSIPANSYLIFIYNKAND